MTAPNCRTPAACPVPDPDPATLARLTTAPLPGGTRLERTYRLAHGPVEFNGSGCGSTRFAPLLAAPGATPVPHLYAARRRTTALLETAFHNVHERHPRIVYAATDLAGHCLAGLVTTADILLADLRDPCLQRLGLDRGHLVTTTADHYPCTREWGAAVRTTPIDGHLPAGLLWHSRVAELARTDSPLFDDLLDGEQAEVVLLWGDRTAPGSLRHEGTTFDDLVTGPGRLLLDQVATSLDAEVH